jgi:acetolactate decarboxylase
MSRALLRSRLSIALLLMAASAVLLHSAPPESNRPEANKKTEPLNTVFQLSTLDALSSGIFQGSMTFHELSKYGDFGVGTFDSLDGEMVALDGRFYQIRSDGTIWRVAGSTTTPFAVVTEFNATTRFSLTQPASMAQITALIDQLLPSPNFFYAVKIHAHFSDITTRSVPKQYPPYPTLAAAVAQQSVFPLHDLKGTLVGFRSPAFVKGINQAGYHFHFIADDEKAGGHALSFQLTDAVIEISVIRQQQMILPDNEAFRGAPLPLP